MLEALKAVFHQLIWMQKLSCTLHTEQHLSIYSTWTPSRSTTLRAMKILMNSPISLALLLNTRYGSSIRYLWNKYTSMGSTVKSFRDRQSLKLAGIIFTSHGWVSKCRRRKYPWRVDCTKLFHNYPLSHLLLSLQPPPQVCLFIS